MRLILFVIAFFPAFFVSAQATKPADSSFRHTLSAILQSYSTGFAGAKGDLIAEDAQSFTYECLLHLPALNPGIISEYVSDNDTSHAWKNVLFESDDFNAAKEQYRKFFAMVRSVGFTYNQNYLALSASYAAPDEDIRFNSIRFTIYPAPGIYKDVVTDLSMEYKMSVWELSLQVYSTAEEQQALKGR